MSNVEQAAPYAGEPIKFSASDIWRLVWPQFLMMLFQFLIGFVDVLVSGRIGPDVQAAFGMVVQCFFFVLVVGATLASAAVSSMSQALGAGRPLRAKRYLGLIMNLGGACCIVIVALSFLLRHEFLSLLQVPEEIFSLTAHIFVIYLCIVPSEFVSIFSGAAFRAHKQVWIPLSTSIVVCVVNGFLDFGLGLGYWGLPNMGADGLALASLGSSIAGASFNLFMLSRMGYLTRASFAPLRWQCKAAPYLIKVAVPAGGMQILWQLGYLVLFAITAALPFGKVAALAGMNAGMRMESILFLPAVAFNLTGTILVGHCLGAGNKKEAKRVGLRVLLAGAGLMSLVALCMWPFVPQIATWLSYDPQVQLQAINYMRFNLFSTPFTVTGMILGGIMTGAGATIYPFIIYGSATWLVRLPLAWYLGHVAWHSSSGIFLAMLISQIFQSTTMLYIFFRCNWTRFSLYDKKYRLREIKGS